LPSLPIQPPVAGSVLQWNEVDQKFTPAQPPAAPVDSVNGETGVVSLGVQDMDDFELYQMPAGPTPIYTGTWDIRLMNTLPDEQGEWRTQVGITGGAVRSILYLNDLDKDGNSFATQWAEIASDPSPWSLSYTDANGTTNGPYQILGINQEQAGRAVYWDSNDFPGGSPAGDLFVEFGRVTTGPTDIPLAEGDILQWNNPDQKFKPVQLPEVINKAKLQAEVAASADFADFQARIAAL